MSHIQRRRIVIVDGYSTARDLIPELLKHNAECLHLRSSEEMPRPVAHSFSANLYDADLGYVGDAATAAMLLSALSPDAVIAGSEWGVTFAETVADFLGLQTNTMERSQARRDKFAMIEAVRRHGVLAPPQARIADVDAAKAWVREHGSWPIVVKPLDSAGSDGVSICYDPADIERAFAAELGRSNFMELVNDSLLVQGYLPGPQFIVNAVSHAGQHYITDIWAQTERLRDGTVVPSHIDLLSPTAAPAPQLMAYTRTVLDALGIRSGASHTEVKLTPAGPALIETGARLMGAAMDAPSYRFAGNDSQAAVFAKVLAGSAKEREQLLARRHYAPRLYMTKLLFNFDRDAKVYATEGLARLASLPSFHAHYRALKSGDRVWRTGDWLCCGGVVYLIHDDANQIAADIETFRNWEKRGDLYDLVGAQAMAAV